MEQLHLQSEISSTNPRKQVRILLIVVCIVRGVECVKLMSLHALAMAMNGFDYTQKRKAYVSNNNVSVCYWKDDEPEEWRAAIEGTCVNLMCS